MMATVGDWVSWASGGVLLVMGLLVIWAFRPASRFDKSAPSYLEWAIFLSFLSAVGNTLFWQVIGQPLTMFGVVSSDQLRVWGDWADLLFKGGAAVSGYLHLKALHQSLPPNERTMWLPIEMPFYPQRRLCLSLIARLIGRRLK